MTDAIENIAERRRNGYCKEFTNAVAEATREYELNMKDVDEWEQNADKCAEIAGRLIDLAKPSGIPDELRAQLRKALMEKLCIMLATNVGFGWGRDDTFTQLIRKAMVGDASDASAVKHIILCIGDDDEGPQACAADHSAYIGDAVPYSNGVRAMYRGGRWVTLCAYVPDLRIDA
jgi:hypothetical protein